MGKRLNLKWITDIIKQDYMKWDDYDRIVIDSQTGTGKTYFIKNVLIPYANSINNKVLLVVNRVSLKRQLKIDLFTQFNIPCPSTNEALDNVMTIGNTTIISYQMLSNKINYGEDVDSFLDSFRYIVMDECHFLSADASFNNKTELAASKLLEDNKQNIKIFISATIDIVREDIEDTCGEIWNYTTGRDYSYLDVYNFKTHDDLIETIKRDDSGFKWLVFVTSKDKGMEFKDDLLGVKTVNFIHTGNKNDNEDLDEIIRNSKFDVDVLISTKVLDNGVNISDTRVKHLVIMANDEITFLQEIGRLRVNIDNAETINLYIPKRSISYFRTLAMVSNRKAEQIALYETDYDEFARRYSRDFYKLAGEIFYLDNNNHWQINKYGLRSYKEDVELYNRMIEEMADDKNAFVREQLSWIGRDNIKTKEIKDVEKTDNIRTYLNKHINLLLDKVQQKELVELLDIRDKSRRLQKSISIIDAYLQENFKMKVSKKRIRIDGKQSTFWIIELL